MTTQNAASLYNTAIAALKKNSLFEAEAALAQAISLDESNATYWEKMGLVWAKMNRHGEAVEALTMASSLSPENADIFYNKGLSHLHIGDNDNGLSCLEQSFKLAPNDELAEKLADIFIERKDFQSASYYLLHIYKKKKEMSREEICSKLANCLFRNGDIEGSHTITMSLVKRFPKTQKYADLLVDIYRRRPHQVFDQDSKNVLEQLLQKDTTKFMFLRNPWISLFLLDQSYNPLHIFTSEQNDTVDINSLSKILSSDFLCLGLHRGLATNIPIENILTNLRKYFLLHWREAEKWPPILIKFLVALAAACWNNEYVFFESSEEKIEVEALKQHIIKFKNAKANEGGVAYAMQIAMLACYIPLYSFFEDESDICVSKKFQSSLSPLIECQITNPKTEAKLAAEIKSFTTVDDKVSLSVQAMYASRPYPRWLGTAISDINRNTSSVGAGLDILVAGCGTGHEPALYANNIPQAHITAIDLSLPSIAYGKRMATKLGIAQQIDFLQGDLMKVGELDKKFDFIASSGVLHHLKDPEKGLQAILDTLKPDGRMSISLYSKFARDYALNPAQGYIKSKGYTPSLDDIRQFRKDLMGMKVNDPITRCTTASDFYSLAECNDLLFHIQEHRYTPHQIWDMASRFGLEPILVSTTPERMKKFRDMFPDGNTLDPDRLDAFEKEHPLAFIEMIKVFFRKKGSTATHPLDFLIFNHLL